MKIDRAQQTWLSEVQRMWIEMLKPASTPLGRHVFDVGPKVPQDAVKGTRVYGTRFDALMQLPKGGVVAEIGTQAGLFAEKILTVCEPEALHLFDIEFDTLRQERPDVPRHPKVNLHLGDSSTQLSKLKDGTFDWIYIDGDHKLAGVRKDATIAAQKLKYEGLMIFNDYTVWSIMEMQDYGVVPIVNELLAHQGWVMKYIALHPLMYCDVAIQRAPCV